MEFLYFLESLRTPVVNVVMQLITELGSEVFFLVAALVTYWCVDKRRGYYLMAVGFLGTILNQFLKLLYRIPRPWVKDPDFTIVESARADATGYSFPSGHSQAAVGTFGCIAADTKRKWMRWLCAALILLVPLSRMYLGVHTPMDVLVGGGSALVLVAALHPIINSKKKWAIPALLAGMFACGLGFLAYVELTTFPADVDAENLNHGLKNAYTLCGAMAGVLIAYYVDEKKLHFSVRAVWWAQILKSVLGLLIAVGIKSLLKAPLYALFHGHYGADALRYFIVVLFAAIFWPMTFRWFEKLGKKPD